MQPKPEPEPRAHEVDTAPPPTLAEIDQRIAAKYKFFREVLVEVVAQLQDEIATAPPGPSGPPGPPGVPGKLPIAKIWRQGSVTYEAEVVCYDGGFYQALKDTGQAPGGSDWICLAVAGRDAKSPHVRGTFDPDAKYGELDIVALSGGSFIARKDDPGPCPGEGWQLLASRGKTGDKGLPGTRGPQGERGEQGVPAPEIVDWQIDPEHYRAIPVMSDGKHGPAIELRGLFEEFYAETRT